ncbi:MAG: alanine--tRNA ligase [Firmicutes bacterium]|nr:alanine--tRNA ligase [Bacillota bacterium]
MSSISLRKMWIEFYLDKDHKEIGSASVIPENDPTVLFTTAGMHPLVPYLMGQKHPQGTRLVNAQKCIRTGDIDEVGDDSHCTFFEMLGNWSLGDYFKKEQIAWSFEFLTSEKYLGIPLKNLAISVFAGDKNASKDEESAKLWIEQGIPKDRIFYLSKEHNWWGPAGQTGPCGPDTEMFFVKDIVDCKKGCDPSCNCGKYLEIWNDVFMQYNKNNEGKFETLAQKNVDTGMGLERTLCVLQGKKSVYETDIFVPIIKKIEEISGQKHGENSEKTKAIRIIADHIRTSVHMIGDIKGITPSNTDQGYVLRRLLRRAIRYANQLNMPKNSIVEVAKTVINTYKDIYKEIGQNQDKILNEIAIEEDRFEKTIKGGLKEFDKLKHYLVGDTISGKAAFKLYDTYGFPLEMTIELAKEHTLKVDVDSFNKCFIEHQAKSSAGSIQKFKGGLADNTAVVTRLHTATHLLHSALKKVLGDDVNQKGSNITEERLRFDFSFNRPMTADEIKKTEDIVNEAIKKDIKIECIEIELGKAKEMGAIGLFGDKYGEKVKVYKIEGYSLEMCGGPHTEKTGELGVFKIVKEQSSSSGVRRIKGVLN